MQIKENAKEELLQEQKNKRKIKSIIRFIFRLICLIVFLFILFETIMGIFDMQRLNDDKEPIWYIDSKTEKTENKEQTTYNLGLYVITKTKEGNKIKIVLKPFFLQNIN